MLLVVVRGVVGLGWDSLFFISVQPKLHISSVYPLPGYATLMSGVCVRCVVVVEWGETSFGSGIAQKVPKVTERCASQTAFVS